MSNERTRTWNMEWNGMEWNGILLLSNLVLVANGIGYLKYLSHIYLVQEKWLASYLLTSHEC